MHLSKKKNPYLVLYELRTNKIIIDNFDDQDKKHTNKEIRSILLGLSTQEFFKYYAKRESYKELPLLTSDNIVIPKID